MLGDSQWFGSPKVSHNSHISTSTNAQTNTEKLTNKYKKAIEEGPGVPRWAIIHTYPRIQNLLKKYKN